MRQGGLETGNRSHKPGGSGRLGREAGIIADRAAGIRHRSQVKNRRIHLARFNAKLGVEPKHEDDPVHVLSKRETHVDVGVQAPHLFVLCACGAHFVELPARVIGEKAGLGNDVFGSLESALKLVDPFRRESNLGCFSLE